MKTLRKIKAVAAAALVLLSVAVADAQDYFSYTGTAQGATNSYAIIPLKTGVPCVFVVDASVKWIDNTNGVSFVSYASGSAQNLTRAGISGTNTLYYAASNGWAVGDVLILSRNKDTAFERHTVSTVTSTNITISGVTAGATASGDHIWRQTAGAKLSHADISVAHGTAPSVFRVINGGQPILGGIDGRPLLVEMQGTQTNILNTVSGRWLPPTLGK